ncbi:hypothetical protein CBM2586_U50001 [Cupriavidus phytorum]|uniref:Uncharacterized protein n=1 Tax=Cupriavidus taiwanensis TaxID=164546 RepID=A0A375CTC1_9BURK|nr:hypothetical protein CBM2586_U50001 [Cupriavidus taiwanensis]
MMHNPGKCITSWSYAAPGQRPGAGLQSASEAAKKQGAAAARPRPWCAQLPGLHGG